MDLNTTMLDEPKLVAFGFTLFLFQVLELGKNGGCVRKSRAWLASVCIQNGVNVHIDITHIYIYT